MPIWSEILAELASSIARSERSQFLIGLRATTISRAIPGIFPVTKWKNVF